MVYQYHVYRVYPVIAGTGVRQAFRTNSYEYPAQTEVSPEEGWLIVVVLRITLHLRL